MLDCQTFNTCCTLDTQAERQQADVPLPRHTLPLRGARQDDLWDRAGLEATDEVLQHWMQLAEALVTRWKELGWGRRLTRSPDTEGSWEKLKTRERVSTLVFPSARSSDRQTDTQASAFLWDILQQPQSWVTKSHCFPLAAHGAAPGCSNPTLPLHTVHFSGGFSNWHIPPCGATWKSTRPQSGEERGGSRTPGKRQVSVPSAFRRGVAVRFETSVHPCVVSPALPCVAAHQGLSTWFAHRGTATPQVSPGVRGSVGAGRCAHP